MNIIELAKQAGLVRNGDIGMKRWEGPQSDSISDQDLEKFAALVAAQEREECARKASIALLGADKTLTDRVLKAIRARGTT